jgi:3-(methylthio)propanoyl-CoA dehydrogenase
MSTYRAPLADMQFLMETIAPINEIAKLPHFEEAGQDTVFAVLDEAGKFASDILDPLNWPGDREGAKHNKADSSVSTPKGFKAAYKAFATAGWNSLPVPQSYGGMGLPQLVATATQEMWHASNMSFALCPLLTQGAIEALMLAGSDDLKKKYLTRMVSGEWTGTMNLTEPQAGTDLALVRTSAKPAHDAALGHHYRIKGQKIYITYGEHDWTENIVHLVLARLPDAPEGVKGISLFVVPKFIVNDDGSLGARNDVFCASIEHKLGIHASPTAVLMYGEKEGAIGYLVGEANRGLEYMFIMMNLARYSVGLEGIGISERAYQRAAHYAKERVQSRDVGGKGGKNSVSIIHHPDVRRMLMSMRSQTEAMRALAFFTGYAFDMAHAHPDEAVRKQMNAVCDLMIPIVKGWSTETAQTVAYDGVQIHGGMGFVEETGAAQHYRDARITTIYEGTTAIQANDLIGRKMAREGGATAHAVIAEMRAFAVALAQPDDVNLRAIHARFVKAVDATERAVKWNLEHFNTDVYAAFAGSVPMLKLFGIVCGGWQLARAALAAAQRLSKGEGDAQFNKNKIITMRFYSDTFFPQVEALMETITSGQPAVMGLDEAAF